MLTTTLSKPETADITPHSDATQLKPSQEDEQEINQLLKKISSSIEKNRSLSSLDSEFFTSDFDTSFQNTEPSLNTYSEEVSNQIGWEKKKQYYFDVLDVTYLLLIRYMLAFNTIHLGDQDIDERIVEELMPEEFKTEFPKQSSKRWLYKLLEYQALGKEELEQLFSSVERASSAYRERLKKEKPEQLSNYKKLVKFYYEENSPDNLYLSIDGCVTAKIFPDIQLTLVKENNVWKVSFITIPLGA